MDGTWQLEVLRGMGWATPVVQGAYRYTKHFSRKSIFFFIPASSVSGFSCPTMLLFEHVPQCPCVRSVIPSVEVLKGEDLCGLCQEGSALKNTLMLLWQK